MMHRFTHALALMLHEGNDAKSDQDYEPIADAIEVTLRGYPDEQKADLYALLADSITPNMPFKALTEAVSSALYLNERSFIRG